jgi:hypothetical protein
MYEEQRTYPSSGKYGWSKFPGKKVMAGIFQFPGKMVCMESSGFPGRKL